MKIRPVEMGVDPLLVYMPVGMPTTCDPDTMLVGVVSIFEVMPVNMLNRFMPVFVYVPFDSQEAQCDGKENNGRYLKQ